MSAKTCCVWTANVTAHLAFGYKGMYYMLLLYNVKNEFIFECWSHCITCIQNTSYTATPTCTHGYILVHQATKLSLFLFDVARA